MERRMRRAIVLSVVASLVLPSASFSHGIDSPLAEVGRYCGTLISGDIESAVQTVFSEDTRGKLTGAYVFDEGSSAVYGILLEITHEPGVAERIFQWRDKYGSGRLVIRFDAQLLSFKGKWGLETGELTFPWDGQPCSSDLTV